MKPLRIARVVVGKDLPAILRYHGRFSPAKAAEILEESEAVVAHLQRFPESFPERGHGWRMYPFARSTYLLFYRELEHFWLVAGVLHSSRDPDSIQALLLTREVQAPEEKG
ncbi:MAG: type II toxin-antitoxin system RelE/ParE family toxin [Opitutales bacterium]